MSTKQISGFFLKVGSKDYPLNYSPNEKFGFDSTSSNTMSGPKFSYSLNDVEKAFANVRVLQKESYFDNNTYSQTGNQEDNKEHLINMLLVESANSSNSYNGVDYSWIADNTINPADTTLEYLQQIFKALEYLYTNQASASKGDNKGTFMNNADAYLGSSQLPGASSQSNPYYCSLYKPGTVTLTAGSLSNRLDKVELVFKEKDAVGDDIRVSIYFNADKFVERDGNVQYAVYKYEDENNDSIISDTEFDRGIVNKIFEILKEGKYKNYGVYTVTKRISSDTYTDEQFFVFSTKASELSTSQMIDAIKKWIEENSGGDPTSLYYTYPELFGQYNIKIVPVWENNITLSDGTNRDVEPITYDLLKSILVRESGNTSLDDINAEIFYIGPGAGWIQTVEVPFIIPLIAIEENGHGVKRPISSRFPDYKPIYGQNYNTDAAEFHYILLKIMSFLKDQTGHALTESFKSTYNINVKVTNVQTSVGSSEATNAGIINTVTFSFAGNTWEVVGNVGVVNE